MKMKTLSVRYSDGDLRTFSYEEYTWDIQETKVALTSRNKGDTIHIPYYNIFSVGESN